MPGTGIPTKNLCPPGAGKNDPGNGSEVVGEVWENDVAGWWSSCVRIPSPP